MSFPRYVSYRDSGVAWLGEVPSHWSVGRLKASVASCRNGLWGEEPDGKGEDIVCIRVADFDRRRLRVSLEHPTLRRLTGREKSGRLLERGNLLLEKSGGGEKQPVGAVVLYTHDAPAVCSNFIARLELEQGMDPGYWVYVHFSMYAARLTERSIKQTSGIQNLDQGRYLDEYVGFPKFQEQVAIRIFLDRETAKIDGLIEVQRRLIELLREKRQAVISHAVIKGLDPTAPTRPSGIEWMGDIPAHWDIVALSRVVDPHRPITYGIVQPGPSDPTGRFMIRGQDYSSGWAEPDEVFRVSASIEEPYRRARLKCGDLLMTIVGAGLGNTALVPKFFEGANITQTTARIAPLTGRVDSDFLSLVMKSQMIRSQVSMFQKGAAQPGLNLEHLKAFRMAMPPISEQTCIVNHLRAVVNSHESLITSTNLIIALLQERRTALVSAAVTGKIDVSEHAAGEGPIEAEAT